MTNADTSILATENLIPDARNPFTGNLLKDSVFKDIVYVAYGPWNPEGQHKNTFKVTDWSAVHDRVYDPDCWTQDIPEGLEEEKE